MSDIGVGGRGSVAARMGEDGRVFLIFVEFFAPTCVFTLGGSAGTGGVEVSFVVLARRRIILARRNTLPIVLFFRFGVRGEGGPGPGEGSVGRDRCIFSFIA